MGVWVIINFKKPSSLDTPRDPSHLQHHTQMESIIAPQQVTDFINQRLNKFNSSSSSSSGSNNSSNDISNRNNNSYRSSSHSTLTYANSSCFFFGSQTSQYSSANCRDLQKFSYARESIFNSNKFVTSVSIPFLNGWSNSRIGGTFFFLLQLKSWIRGGSGELK